MSVDCQRAVWIIGAGYLGSELALQGRSLGLRVLTIDKARPADVCGDAAQEQTLRRASELLPCPGTIFCCVATHGGDARAYRSAYESVASRLVCSVRTGCRLIFCSSTGVYEGKGGAVVTEECECPGGSERHRVLLRAEQEVLRAGETVLRLAPLYGPDRCELVRRYRSGESRLPGAEDRFLNYLHVDDAAAALLLLSEVGNGRGLYNACGESLTIRQAYAMLREELGEIPRSSVTHRATRREGTNQIVSSAKLRALGWEPRHSLRQMMTPGRMQP